MLTFALGWRDKASTERFIEGLRAAASLQRFQITTDGFAPYVNGMMTPWEIGLTSQLHESLRCPERR